MQLLRHAVDPSDESPTFLSTATHLHELLTEARDELEGLEIYQSNMLLQLWNLDRGDSCLCGSSACVVDNSDYEKVRERIECLFHFTPCDVTWQVRLEGFQPSPSDPDAIPLLLFYSKDAQDNFATTSNASIPSNYTASSFKNGVCFGWRCCCGDDVIGCVRLCACEELHGRSRECSPTSTVVQLCVGGSYDCGDICWSGVRSCEWIHFGGVSSWICLCFSAAQCCGGVAGGRSGVVCVVSVGRCCGGGVITLCGDEVVDCELQIVTKFNYGKHLEMNDVRMDDQKLVRIVQPLHCCVRD